MKMVFTFVISILLFGYLSSQPPAILGDNNLLVRADDECIYQVTVPTTIGSWYYYQDSGGEAEFRNFSDPSGNWGDWRTDAYGIEGEILQARYPGGTTNSSNIYTCNDNLGGYTYESNPDDNINCCTVNEPGVTCLSALPISFLSKLIVEIENKSAILKWETAQQINNEKFIIQHSSSKQSFKTIGEIKAAGTTIEIQSYEFIHRNPTLGMNYYRIKQVDFDGKYSYSDVVSVYFEGEELFVFPNPGKEIITINSTKKDNLHIFNQYGKQIGETRLKEGENKVDLHHLQSGMYIFKTESGKAMRWVKL